MKRREQVHFDEMVERFKSSAASEAPRKRASAPKPAGTVKSDAIRPLFIHLAIVLLTAAAVIGLVLLRG